jgi:hypothetical protein
MMEQANQYERIAICANETREQANKYGHSALGRLIILECANNHLSLAAEA